ncbi:MAG: ribosome assembly cofactor RimP [Sphingobacteriales bacterium]|nr:MAG: ribosome assembly cofactor RimP [Sphingobacteriales bacterium]TAF79295.1 MAG: ribosome assembly cofactor RimP [Sphingobacteriales bacterium]
MNIENRVRQLVTEKIANRPDLFIVSVKISNKAHVSILLDGDNGIGIHDCALISRHVGFCLEEENTLNDAYTLEVSSAGVGAPLVLQRQYFKNIGRTITLKLKSGEKLEGFLNEVNDTSITLSINTKQKGKKTSNENINITYSEIAEAIVQVSFK